MTQIPLNKYLSLCANNVTNLVFNEFSKEENFLIKCNKDIQIYNTQENNFTKKYIIETDYELMSSISASYQEIAYNVSTTTFNLPEDNSLYSLLCSYELAFNSFSIDYVSLINANILVKAINNSNDICLDATGEYSYSGNSLADENSLLPFRSCQYIEYISDTSFKLHAGMKFVRTMRYAGNPTETSPYVGDNIFAFPNMPQLSSKLQVVIQTPFNS